MKTIIKIFFLLASFSLTSQVDTLSRQINSKAKIKEYYLTFADFSPVSIHLKYKRQIGKKIFLKIGFINLSAYKNSQKPFDPNTFPTETSGYSAGLQIGIEFRKALTNKFSLFHGPNLNYTYSNSTFRLLDPAIPTKEQKDISVSQTSSIPYTLGILFNINANILIAGEINPAINFMTTDFKKGQNPKLNSTTTNTNFSFDNRYCLISIVYRP